MRSQLPQNYLKLEPISVFDWESVGQTASVFNSITIAGSVLELVPEGEEPEGYVPGGGRCVKLWNATAIPTATGVPINSAAVSGVRTAIDLVDENTLIEFAVYYPDTFLSPAAGLDFYLCTTNTSNNYHKAYYPAGTDTLKGWNTYSFNLQALIDGVVDNSGMSKTGSPNINSIDYFRLQLLDNANPSAEYVIIGPIRARRRAMTQVTLSFDDGHHTVIDEALPLMRTHGFKGNLGIITSYIGTTNYMTLSNIAEFAAEDWSINAHSVTHSNFVSGGLTDTQIRDEVVNSVTALRELGYPCRFFIWPGGGCTESSKSACREVGILAGFDIASRVDPAPWVWGSGEYGRVYRVTMEATSGLDRCKNWLDEAIRQGVHVHFYFHVLTTDASVTGNTNITDFTNFLIYLREKTNAGLCDVVTFDEYYEGMADRQFLDRPAVEQFTKRPPIILIGATENWVYDEDTISTVANRFYKEGKYFVCQINDDDNIWGATTHRVEMVCGNGNVSPNGTFHAYNTAYRFDWTLKCDEDWPENPVDVLNPGMLFFQVKNLDPQGWENPAILLQHRNGNFELVYNYKTTPSSVPNDQISVTVAAWPAVQGEYDISIRFLTSLTQGKIELWVDGELLGARYDTPIGYLDADDLLVRYGVYRWVTMAEGESVSVSHTMMKSTTCVFQQ